MTATILIGLPATGKSSFCSKYFQNNSEVISMDILNSRSRETKKMEECISLQRPFIIDNTNATKADRTRYILAAKSGGYKVCGYYFYSTVKDAVKRNQLRDKTKNVPDVAIFSIAKRFEHPAKEEGFDELYFVRLGGNESFIIQQWDTQ